MKIIKLVGVLLGVVLVVGSYIYMELNFIILPTNSSAQKLTIVEYGYCDPTNVILKNYTDDGDIKEYVLELKAQLYTQHPQRYKLPYLKDGMVEIIVHEKSTKKNLTITYEKAENLYNCGLLIYFNTDFRSSITKKNGNVDRNDYIHFISGRERNCYFRKAGTEDWIVIMDAPTPKKFTPFFTTSTSDSNWKEENKWELSSDVK